MHLSRPAIRTTPPPLALALRRFWRSDWPTALAFLLPAILVLGVFSFYPMFDVFRLSVFKWDNLAPVKEFIGLRNFQSLFASSRFWNSMWVTAKYTTVVTLASLALGLVLAVILNNRYLAYKSFWRSLFFLPIITPTVAAAMVTLMWCCASCTCRRSTGWLIAPGRYRP
jgi:multiple sugar transport system permease protein